VTSLPEIETVVRLEVPSLAMITYEGVKLILVAPRFLTSAPDTDERPASRPCRFTPGKEPCGTHCIRGWMGPSASLDATEKRKICYPCRESNPICSVVQLHKLKLRLRHSLMELSPS
jgi:hypothetical protein